MDKDSELEKLGSQPLVDLLIKIGGWSVSPSQFNLSSWSLQTQMQILHNDYNMGGFFQWAVGEDERNSTKHIIQVGFFSYHNIPLVSTLSLLATLRWQIIDRSCPR